MTALDLSTQGIEAQKLISISLGKMAASRVGKGGSSLHKSLLVASVLQRARHVFLEENYHNYHYRGPAIAPMPMYGPHVPPPPPCEPPTENNENRCATPMQQEMLPQMPQEPQQQQQQEECCDVPQRMPLADASNQQQQQQRAVALKRRRCVSDKETQEAVSSILPKRFRSCSDENVNPNCAASYEETQHLPCAQQDCAAMTFDASSFPPVCNASSLPAVCPAAENSISSCSNVLVPIPISENVLASSSHCATGDCSYENALPEGARETNTSTTMMSPSVPNPIYCTLEPISDDEEEDDDVNSMEVEHITSLVSIFSFGAPRQDLCATQAAREEHAQFTPVALAV